MENTEETQVELLNDIKNMEETQVEQCKDMENTEENSEKIWKLWKKSRLNN